MEHQEGFFQAVRDIDIYYQIWLPESPPKAILLVAHGLAEHCGRYMNLVNHFVPLGYGVYGVDYMGHGKSEGPRVHVQRFEDFTDTLRIFFDMIQKRQPGKSVFLIGHSMGGLIAAYYLLDHQADLTGAILSAPSVKVPDNISSARLTMGRICSALLPKLGIIHIDPEGVSRDPAVVKAYVDDPLVYTGKATARLVAELFKAMQRVSAEAATITLPILILQGGDDRLVDPAGAQMLYDGITSTDKTLKVYDGLYHEVFNEPEHEQVLHDLQRWLESHMGPRG
ncbi:MAG: lysophospholipase [Desulfobacteraceae bacterium]